jgi:hypothetical protein
MRKLIGITALLVLGTGCATRPAEVAPATIPTGNNIAAADAYVDAASGNVDALKPHADATGKVLADAAQSNHGNARVELHKAAKANEAATKQLTTLRSQYGKLEDEHTKLEQSTGVKVERLIRKLIAWCLIYLGVMVALRVAALFVTGPVGAVMATVSTVMWPGAWFHAAADNYWFRKKANASTSTTVAVEAEQKMAESVVD